MLWSWRMDALSSRPKAESDATSPFSELAVEQSAEITIFNSEGRPS
jgi:hypothetical protein